MENIKSTCDCVKMTTDLMKIKNDLLESETDKMERKELIESDNYKQWKKKSWELTRYWSKNYSDNFSDIVKCKEYHALSKEQERARKLHE
jgi:hypothetical protein